MPGTGARGEVRSPGSGRIYSLAPPPRPTIYEIMQGIHSRAVAPPGIAPLLSVLVGGVALFLAGSGPLAAQAAAVEGAIRGEVVDETTGEGVPAVQVEFLDTRGRVRASATSDGAGVFVLPRVPAGSFRLRSTRIGYATTATDFDRVEAGEVMTVVLRIHPEAVPLAPLEVTSRRRVASPLLEGFHLRRERGAAGSYLTREDVERRAPLRLTDLLQSLPGIRITTGPGFGSNRLVSMVPPGPARSSGACPVQVFVDGLPASRRILMAGGGGLGPLDGVPVDDLVSPGEIEGVEVYRGLEGVPPEFLTPDAGCGVIAIWTRRDP
jgi:hypothetical protein